MQSRNGRVLRLLALVLAWVSGLSAFGAAGTSPVHVWQRQELTFQSARPFANPYTDVTVWVDLTGPGFSKRVYGFWDGGNTFRVRLVATARGTWHWKSGSAPADPGLAGKTGSFEAIDWTEAEKREDPLRRGFLRPTPIITLSNSPMGRHSLW